MRANAARFPMWASPGFCGEPTKELLTEQTSRYSGLLSNMKFPPNAELVTKISVYMEEARKEHTIYKDSSYTGIDK